jgi:hypothetical protein
MARGCRGRPCIPSIPVGRRQQSNHLSLPKGSDVLSWDAVIRAKQFPAMTPLLEGVLSKVTGLHARGPRIAALLSLPSRSPANTRGLER